VTAWITYPSLFLMVALQTSLAPQLEIGRARPELVLCWVVCWAVVRGRGEAVAWAIAGGVLLDLTSQLPLGSHVLALALVAFLADLGHTFLRGSTLLFALVATFVGSLVYGGVLVLFVTGVVRHEVVATMLGQVLPGAVYSVVAVIPMFFLLRTLDRRFPVPVAPEW
jgi:rod shape-determining protein MreD